MLQHSVSLYVATALIWGSTWYAIKFQLGVVAPEVSLTYRFGLAAVILFAYCRLRGLNLRFSPEEHFYIGLQGLSLFCINYLIVYWATTLLATGLIAVIFSTIVFMNILYSAIFFRQPVDAKVLGCALCGLAGITLVFWPELSAFRIAGDGLRGMALSLLATTIASLGTMVATRNQNAKLPVVQTNAWGMTYGAVVMAIYAWWREVPFNYGPSTAYGVSLLYLSVFGSVLAFGSFLTLVGRIGADRAAYVMVLFPVIALIISTYFESYRWSASAVAGVALVLSGNLLILINQGSAKRVFGLASSRRAP